MSKQDRQGARTPAQLEQEFQFGKSFAEAMGLAQKAKDEAQEAKKAAEDLDKSLDPTEIFNRLTNNGEEEALYREDGRIYFNGSYIKTGILLADLIKAGVLKSKDGETFYLDLDNGVLKGKFAELNINGKTVDEIAEDKAKSAANDAVGELSQEDVFNKLTNNGALKGIYMENGELYGNASFLKSGIIDAAVVQVANLIAERLKSVSGSSVLNIDGANLEFRSNENRTMWLTNTYEGQPRLYLWEFDGDSRVNTSEMSPHHLKIGGTSTMPKFVVELLDPVYSETEEWSRMEIDSINPGKKILFSGNITMGNTCVVPATRRYDLFAVRLGDSTNTYQTVVLAYKTGKVVRGVGGWAGTATESKQLYFFSATISGETWTVEDAGVHNVYIGGGVEAGNRLNLKEIIGVI